ncbi:DUF5074 domain-containing protein [Dyadobacter sp.]|uniref:DUF5074 domain-containing protein n=1 Tax=Dyadobacter sp. TaxID=1914288 RepID=UPI0025BB10CF|nr:DUF5074 domain-containing protein [Dyadobacter sp.]
MKKQLASSLAIAFLTLAVWSCNQSDPAPKGDYVSGVFVMNEGNFTNNNGGISYFARENNTATADIFAAANGTVLKGGVQDYTASEQQGIILVDNSTAGQDKVQFVERYTFKDEGTIGAPDIENPREVIIVGRKAYVSCWGTNSDLKYTTGYIAVIDLTTKKVTKKINVADGPENLAYANGKLYVGTTLWGAGNKLAIININSDEATSPITTSGAANPVGIDANGKLWVNVGDKMLRINTETNVTEATLAIATEGTKTPGNFTFSNDLKSIFFVLSWYDSAGKEHGGTYKFSITDTQIAMVTPLIPRPFYGLAVDPTQGLLYAGVSPSYTQAGYAVRYRADGSLVDSVKVGIAPSGFFFQ